MSENVPSKEEISFDLKLARVDGVMALAQVYKAKAKSIGVDTVTHVVVSAAEAVAATCYTPMIRTIASAQAKRPASYGPFRLLTGCAIHPFFLSAQQGQSHLLSAEKGGSDCTAMGSAFRLIGQLPRLEQQSSRSQHDVMSALPLSVFIGQESLQQQQAALAKTPAGWWL